MGQRWPSVLSGAVRLAATPAHYTPSALIRQWVTEWVGQTAGGGVEDRGVVFAGIAAPLPGPHHGTAGRCAARSRA